MRLYYYAWQADGMPVADPWSVLGVDRSASPAEIRRAYLLRSQLVHPDHHRNASEDVQAEAERAMRALTEAWDALRGGDAAPEPPTHDQPMDVDSTARWVVERMVEAAAAQGDPMSHDEIDRLLGPVQSVTFNRRVSRWLEHRQTTLARAVERDGTAKKVWSRALRTLDEDRTGSHAVVLLLRLEATGHTATGQTPTATGRAPTGHAPTGHAPTG